MNKNDTQLTKILTWALVLLMLWFVVVVVGVATIKLLQWTF